MLDPPPQALHSIASSKQAASRQAARRFRAAVSAATLASHNNAYSQNKLPKPVKPGGRSLPAGGASRAVDGAVVETATATLAKTVPFGVSVLGVSVQVDSEGAPVHTKFTAWLNPSSEPTVRL